MAASSLEPGLAVGEIRGLLHRDTPGLLDLRALNWKRIMWGDCLASRDER